MPVMPESAALFQITMTHAELETAIGAEAVALIEKANFVLVPRLWRERAFEAMQEVARVRSSK